MFGISARRAVVCSCVPILLAAAVLPGCMDRPVCADCKPETINLFVNRVPTGGVDKVDLLFMIDGSASMADKQVLLKAAVPSLISRFLDPLCLNDMGQPIGKSTGGDCATGSAEFPPIEDLHIGVISSNLGSVGGSGCAPRADRLNDDHAWLLPKARPSANLASYQGLGFLAWDPAGRKIPAGTNSPMTLTSDFANMVAEVRENGCGYEASLESWYRFLIDPDPPERIELQGDVAVPVGTDTTLLQQREQFLRPDSLVAVIMLTDENDCSLQSAGSAWLATQSTHPADPDQPFYMPRATAACATNPDDPCCRSCLSRESTPPNNCSSLQDDVECRKGVHYDRSEEDGPNNRCFDQKRRFGIDFLEPVEKYIRGLTAQTVVDRHGAERENPLFARRNAISPRAPNHVFLAGILGVPWQSIATPESLTGPGLKYLRASELAAQNRWDMILGDPKTRRPPTDPHMIESIAARSGAHPLVASAVITPATSTNPRADVISGHEHADARQNELQHACIFELEAPRDCTASGAANCDCKELKDVEGNRALCQPPGGGPAGHTQYFAKAYPGTRHLEVLKGLGEQAVVASICAKVTRSADPTADPSYGYNPAMDAIVSSMAVTLANQCLGREPAVDKEGKLSCVVAEAQYGNACACNAAGRSPARPDVLRKIREDLKADDLCDQTSTTACADVCACEIAEAEGAALQACRTQKDASSLQPGYCYVDPALDPASAALVEDCPGNKKRLLRFVGPDTPVSGAIAFMACMGANLAQ
jgi:hypothetical protein